MRIAELISDGPCEECHWTAGQLVTRQGEANDALFVVLDGAVQVWSQGADRSDCVGTLVAGDVFGEVSVLDPGPATATVRALGASRGLKLRRADLERLWVEDPDRARRLERHCVEALAARLRRASRDGGVS